jgi:hypothetical protein
MIFLPLSIDQSNLSSFCRDARFGTGERELGLAGEEQRAGAVAAIGGDHLDLEPLVGDEAFRQRDIHRNIELRAHDLGHLELDLVRRTGGRQRHARRYRRPQQQPQSFPDHRGALSLLGRPHPCNPHAMLSARKAEGLPKLR